MDTMRLVFSVVVALCGVIAAVASVAAYREQRRRCPHLMQVEVESNPDLCFWCSAPAVAIGEQWEAVCAEHAPRCPCGDVAVGKGYTGWACAEHWPMANHPPIA